MTNQVLIIGRLVKNPKEGDNQITLACPRSFKNTEGVYETDFIDIDIYNMIATNVIEYCRKGDLIGIRGRVESTYEDDGDGHMIKRGMRIIAEKITFLSSRPSNDNSEERSI